MSRRDTIIIAVLVNAGLLMVLFATAMRSNKKEEAKPSAEIAEVVPQPAPAQQQPLAREPAATVVAAAGESILDATVGSSGAQETELTQLGEEIEISTQEMPVAAATETPLAAPAAPVATLSKPTPAPKAEQEVISVTVKKGDVLEKIAKTHRSSVAAIMKASNISSTNLKIGQVLKVPQNVKKDSSAAVAKKEGTTAKTPEYYTVKDGDSPWLIASRNHVKLDELLRLNGMDEEKARHLRPGDKLRIR
jgi:peptidoglycan endopeptidase LytF